MAMEPCRKAVRERLLSQMLGAVQDSIGGGWKVLVLDTTTTKLMSTALRMSDILDANVSVVEDLEKTREPLQQAAVYFITPTMASVKRLLADFEKKPLYPSVHIFFSSSAPMDVVEVVKRNQVLLGVLGTLKEVNLELLLIDGHTLSTDNPGALLRCMGARADPSSPEWQRELDLVAMRLATLFATMSDMPAIRYRAGRPPQAGDAPGAQARHELTLRLARKVTERVNVMQRNGLLPATPSCDLVLLDRSLDPVAPFVHDWTYEALVYDLLSVEDKAISYVRETAGGKTEVKPHLLDEGDELWVELRHQHLVDVFNCLGRKGQELGKSKAAQQSQRKTGEGGEVSALNMRNLVMALPGFQEAAARLGVHTFISQRLKDDSLKRHLTDVGQMEQELIYGDRNSSDLIAFMKDHGKSLEPGDKLRLLLCYLATHPEKLDATKAQQWCTAAGLDRSDMDTLTNLAFLNVAVMKPEQQSKSFLSGLGNSKKKKGTYPKPEGWAQDKYAVVPFDPLLKGVVEEALAGRLNGDDYPYVDNRQQEAEEFGAFDAGRVGSVRTNKSTSWARGGSRAAGSAGSGPSAVFSGASQLFAGRRLVVFVLGGITRGEMRAVHQLAKKHGRDVLLVSTGVLKPASAVNQLAQMNAGSM